jgi:uncharacterized membrane protein YgdD (TMEM256/DUF423 family)
MTSPPVARACLTLGALSAFAGVALAAYGAHGLQGALTPERMATFQSALQLQLFHALGLLLVGAIALRAPSRLLAWAGALMFVGIALFCGSLYLAALSGERNWSAPAPAGGVAFLLSWLALAAAAWRR